MCHHVPKPVDYVPCSCCKVPSPINLVERYHKKFRAPKRIKTLAKPKLITPKFSTPKVERFKIETQIFRDDEISTRLKQLALPKVRKLLAAKNEYSRFKSRYFIRRYDDLIKKSLFTVYSRLSNIEVPPASKKPDKWTDAEWREHQQWLSTRAKPKWPYDYKIPPPFTHPITKIKKGALTAPVSSYFKQYAQQLSYMADSAKDRIEKEFYETPPLKSEEWKVKREKLKTKPVREYIEEYAEKLRAQADEAKVKRAERLQELHPSPHPKINYGQYQKQLEKVYKSVPEWVSKKSQKPGWIEEQANKDQSLKKEMEERRKAVCDRTKLKSRPNRRTLELALATKEQKETLMELLEISKKERDALNKTFQCTKAQKNLKLPPTSRLHTLSEQIARKKREKVVFPEVTQRFVNYW